MFSSRTPALLHPNRLTAALAARREARKPILDLTLSNPTRAGFEYPEDLLQPLADRRALTYDPQPLGTADARQAVAADYARRGVVVAPDRIVLTSSTSEAYSLVFKLLANAGDDVLVPRPSYPLFDHLTRLDLVHARPYDLEYHGAWTIDVESVERALTPRTRAILLVSPNNPTGSFVSAGELDRIAAIAADRDVAIVADEVFADYELEPGAAGRAGRVATRDDVLSFALGGLSKTVGLPQVKLGWVAVAGPAARVAAALERLELICDTYLSVSTPAQVAVAALLDGGAGVRAQIAARVCANYARLKAAVAGSACTCLRSDGGWYGVVRVPTFEPEDDLVVGLLDAEGVLAHPGYFFDFAHESFLVISLLPPDATFADGLARALRYVACADDSNQL